MLDILITEIASRGSKLERFKADCARKTGPSFP